MNPASGGKPTAIPEDDRADRERHERQRHHGRRLVRVVVQVVVARLAVEGQPHRARHVERGEHRGEDADRPQHRNLLIKGGRVIDPRNNIDAVMDVAVSGGKITRVAANIQPAAGMRVIDATGLYVVPGLIDIHAHVFFGTEKDAYLSNADSAVQPDAHSFRSGQTTLVDAGGPGWRNFLQFKEHVIDRSRTRVLAFINIVGSGMKGGPVEQNLADMDAKLTAMRIRQHRASIVGIKVAHYIGGEWDPVDSARSPPGSETNVPVMVDFGRTTRRTRSRTCC